MEAIINQLQGAVKTLSEDGNYKEFDILIQVDDIKVINIAHIDDVYSLIGVNEDEERVIRFCHEFVPTLVLKKKANEHRVICGFNPQCTIDELNKHEKKLEEL